MPLRKLKSIFGQGGAAVTEQFGDSGLRAVLDQLRGLKALAFTAGGAISAGVKASANLSDGTNNTLSITSGRRGVDGNLTWYETLRRDAVFGLGNVFDLTIWRTLDSAGVTFVNTTDQTNELITLNGHGYRTGEGPFRLSNSGGGLPAGTTGTTLYWLIANDANTFALATSYANAIAGTKVNLTGNGTGTCKIHRMVAASYPSLSMNPASSRYALTVVNQTNEDVVLANLASGAAENRPSNTAAPAALSSGAGDSTLSGLANADHIAFGVNITTGAVVAAEVSAVDSFCLTAGSLANADKVIMVVLPAVGGTLTAS